MSIIYVFDELNPYIFVSIEMEMSFFVYGQNMDRHCGSIHDQIGVYANI